MNEKLITIIRQLERSQMIEAAAAKASERMVDARDLEIERLRKLNGEILEWIRRHKNKLHPCDPIHEILKRAAEVER